MRLLILTHDYPPQMFGGIGSFANNLANALSKKGVGVVVLAGCPPRPLKTGVIAARTTVNKNLEVIRVPRMDFPPSRIWYQLMNLNKIRDLVADFDIIHSQDQSAFPIICLCKKNRPEIPWVVTVHSNPVPELYYSIRSVASLESSVGDVFTNLVGFPLSDLAIRTESKLADALVPVSEELRRQIRDQYRVAEKKLFTIHNGVNVAELESEARMNQLRGTYNDKVSILYAGRLYWSKGILHLLKSLFYLNVKFTNYQLRIFGEGPLRHKISSLVSRYHLEKNVKLEGFVAHPELITAMAGSDIVCIPSLYEACPMVMIEAMILGKPVVAFNKPFSQELLNGIPNAPLARTIQDYAYQIHSLCTSENLRRELGRRLREMAVRRFDVERMAEKYLELYHSILP